MTEFLTRIALKHRKKVYIIACIITLVFIGIIKTTLTMDTDWKEMLPQNNEIVKNFVKVTDNFSDITQLIITVSGKNAEEMKQVADEIAEKIMTVERKKDGKQIKVAKSVYHKMPMEFFENHALMSMKASDLKDSLIMLDDPNVIASLDGINTALEKSYTGGEGDTEKLNDDEQKLLSSLQGMIDFFKILTESAGGEISDKRVQNAVDLISVGEPYFFSHDKSMLLIYVELAHSLSESMDMSWDGIEIIEQLNAWKAEKIANGKLKGIDEIGYTGMSAIGKDKLDALSIFTLVFSLVAFVVIFIVLCISFRQISFPLLGGIVLIVGIIWGVGTITLIYGRLQMFTAVCSFIFIGLGIDFVIHIMTRYTEERGFGRSITESISLALNHTGPAVIAGGLTTSAAFFALMISSMDGFVEFGVATGAGMLFQLVVTLFLLPSLLVSKEVRSAKKLGFTEKQVLEHESDEEKTKNIDVQKTYKLPRTDFPVLGSIVHNVFKNPRSAVLILIVLVVLTVFSALGGKNASMEYNVMKQLPEGFPSIELQNVIREKYDQSPNITWVLAEDLEEARAITDYYKTKVFVHEGDKIYKAVGFVDSVTNIVQNDYEQAKASQIIDKFRKTYDKTELRSIRHEDASWLFSEKPSTSDIIEYNNLADNLEKSSVVREENQAFQAIFKRLKDNFIEMYSMSIQGGLDKLTKKLKTFGIGIGDNSNTVFDKMIAIMDSLFKENPQKFVENINRFNASFFTEFKNRIIKMSNTEQVTEDMLPELMRNMYLSKIKDERTGKETTLYAISLFSKKEVWEREPLESFVKAITQKPLNPLIIEEKKLHESTGKSPDSTDNPFSEDDDDPFTDDDEESPFDDKIKKADDAADKDVVTNIRTIETLPKATGMPQLMLLLSNETKREGVRVGLYALIAIFIILLVQFLMTAKFTGIRSIFNALGYTFLAAIPLFFSLSWMLGFMYLLGIKFNYLNFIAIPVIIGIGVDDGVHFVHRYRKEGNGSLRLVSTSVGKAILLTTITTGIGFGTLITNPFPGLASFGMATTIGIVSCLFSTILIIPAILRIKEYFQRYKGYNVEK
ncbi:MAG: MMPL family transporter [Planctomycetes bacterium]|nr:MMPL family transporter [Planctomycetota bacterium]